MTRCPQPTIQHPSVSPWKFIAKPSVTTITFPEPTDSPKPALDILRRIISGMNLLFVLLPTVHAFTANPAKGQVGQFYISRTRPMVSSTNRPFPSRPRAAVPTTKCIEHYEPDNSNIIEDARRTKRRKILKASTIGALGLLAVASRSSVANAARKTVSATVPVLELPSTKTLAIACLVPTLLGFYKSGPSQLLH